MRKFWLMDRHGSDGPSALVETDGGLHIIDIVRFGPTVAELDAQQKVWDEVIGRVAPTLKPCVKASSVDEEGVAPHAELQRSQGGASGSMSQADRRAGGRTKGSAGRRAGGPSRTRSRGER